MRLNTEKWIRFFNRNRRNRPEPDWNAPLNIPEDAKGRLFQSLREFQLGDGGGPASLIAWNKQRWQKSDAGLDKVVCLWFEEEKEHSRLLGGLLQRYGVESIRSHWSFSLFCWVRRLLGVKFELQVLTLTEISSTAYYRMLRKHGTDSALQEVCSLILRDESGHLSFQADRLRADGAPWSGWRHYLWKAQFMVCGLLATFVLWASHGPCLRKLGVTTLEFYKEAAHVLGRFLLRLELRPAKRLASSTATCLAKPTGAVQVPP